VNILGFGAEIEQITIDMREPYLRVKETAEGDNAQHGFVRIILSLSSTPAQTERGFHVGVSPK
jgi:hypothetical protein